MRRFAHPSMAELARQLATGLLRLRKGYVDAAESLIRLIDPAQSYPYEFLVYRLTGYRPMGDDQPTEPLPGKALRADLQSLMIEVSESFALRAEDYGEPVYDTQSLARLFDISTKTVQRWRRRGLPARKLTFPDGRRRLGFLESSVQWFTRSRRRKIARSVRFSQMSETERRELLRRARRMAGFTRCTLADVARRLARRTGRSPETIRYTIRGHDRDNPDDAIFPDMAGPLGDAQRTEIYRSYLHGVSVRTLARKYRRTRGSIYRIVNETRAQHLLARPIDCVYNPEFDLPNADEEILSESTDAGGEADPVKPPPGLPAYLRSLYDVPLLSRTAERGLFRRYNYLKYKADKLRRQLDVNRLRSSELKRVEKLLLRASAVKNRIVRANLRLVVSIAKKHLGGVQGLFELISDGNVSLMQAVEKFDYARGNRFSTYASWAIMRNFARSVPRARYHRERFTTGQEDLLDIAGALRNYDPNDLNVSELRESIDAVLAQLSPRERTILVGHYGLGEDEEVRTLEQLGERLGLSKERVRQIEIKALRKLRRILQPQRADLLA